MINAVEIFFDFVKGGIVTRCYFVINTPKHNRINPQV